MGYGGTHIHAITEEHNINVQCKHPLHVDATPCHWTSGQAQNTVD